MVQQRVFDLSLLVYPLPFHYGHGIHCEFVAFAYNQGRFLFQREKTAFLLLSES